MKTFILGSIIGYQLHKYKTLYEYMKSNPEDPEIIKMKAGFGKIKDYVKKDWADAMVNFEFKDIVKKNGLENKKD